MFNLHAMWTKQIDVNVKTSTLTILPRSASGFLDLDGDADGKLGSQTRWERMIIRPTSGPRLAWGVVALFLMAYEGWLVPLTFFSIRDHSLDMAVRIFWTCDLLLQFLMGYQTLGGGLEMRPDRVAKHYLSTWFPFDALLIMEDWIDYLSLLGTSSSQASVERVIRCVRMIRLLRVAKLIMVCQHYVSFADIFSRLLRNVDSDALSGAYIIIRNAFLWVWVNHVCACSWYGLGLDHANGENWISTGDWADAPVAFIYAQSYLYSLSMYGCPTDVGATHVGERYATICMMIFAYMMSAYIISSMATAMTQVTIATAQEAKQLSILNQYLIVNGISTATAKRVQLNARQSLLLKKRQKEETDIELLQIISKPLLVELHFEIHMPILGWHPFFDIASEESSTFMRHVCHDTLSQITLASRDLVFEEGEASLHQHMYFLTRGMCQYRQSSKSFADSVHIGEWACEAVLWTTWIHCGSMRAKDDSTLLAMDSVRFQTIASQFGAALGYVQRYSTAFVKHLEGCEREALTDLEDVEMDVEWLASKTRLPPDPAPGAMGKIIRASLGQPSEPKPDTSAMIGVRRGTRRMSNLFFMNLGFSKQKVQEQTPLPATRKSRKSELTCHGIIVENEDGDEEDSPEDVPKFAAKPYKDALQFSSKAPKAILPGRIA